MPMERKNGGEKRRKVTSHATLTLRISETFPERSQRIGGEIEDRDASETFFFLLLLH